MSDIEVLFLPWVTAWFLLGEAVPYITAAMAGLVAAVLLSRRSGHARLRRWLRLPIVIVGAAWLAPALTSNGDELLRVAQRLPRALGQQLLDEADAPLSEAERAAALAFAADAVL